MHRTLGHNIGPTLALLAAAALSWPSTPHAVQDPAPAAQRTVILVRHAEKVIVATGAEGAEDPALTAAGQRRAQALARLLGKTGATRLITSEFQRSRDTLAPLAAALGVAVESKPAKEIDALATDLGASSAGSVTVVAGHSNTLPRLAAKLGVPLPGLAAGSQLGDDEYDRLFVVTLPSSGSAARPALVELRYGEP
jgi:phosphohistidine phosphatase SixA